MWAVVRTKPNQEIRAKTNLENQGFSTYLPILNQKKFYRGKWTDYNEIIFKGYISKGTFGIVLKFGTEKILPEYYNFAIKIFKYRVIVKYLYLTGQVIPKIILKFVVLSLVILLKLRGNG